jgi:hypothetical protein
MDHGTPYLSKMMQRVVLPAVVYCALGGNTQGFAQPGVFTVGVPEPPMEVLQIEDTVEGPAMGLDQYAFDPDNDGLVDLSLRSRRYFGGQGSGQSLEILCGDSTTLATATAVDSVDFVLGGPVTVDVPRIFSLGEQTTGTESYADVFFMNHFAYATLPGAVAADLHAWNAVVDGFLVFKKVEQGVAHYGWMRLDTYGPQSSFAVVKEIGFDALTTGLNRPVTRGPALLRTGDGFLVDGEAGSVLVIMDADGRLVHSSRLSARGPTIVSLPELMVGLYHAVLRSGEDIRLQKFVVADH